MTEPDVQAFELDGIKVLLVRDAWGGARWECSACPGDCEHKLKAAAWMTVKNWSQDGIVH